MKRLILFYQLLITLMMGAFANTANAQTCQLNVSAASTDSRCKATGTITIQATNGSGNYTYLVTGPSSYSSTTSSNIIEGLQAGVYAIKVKDITSGCTASQTNIVIGGNYQDPRFSLTATDVTCYNAANGSVAVANLQYGRGPFTYTLIAPSASHTGISNTTGTFANLIAGDYYVQLTDSCGGIQTRNITISNYSWTPAIAAVSKPTCDSVLVTLSASDNKGNSNNGNPIFNGFLYGATITPGDTVWSSANTFHFYKGNHRSVTLIVKDGCGNIQTLSITDSAVPTVDASVSISNYQCSSFTATVTGQQNLTNPQYCLYNSSNTLISCNTTGIFTAVAYGSYCIAIKDNCYDTTFNRCFNAAQPVPSADNAVAISNYTCNSFSAAVTGQQNLTNPQYCITDSNNVTIACNTTGVFDNLAYGRYCIAIKDGCTGQVLTRCFTQKKPVPSVAANIAITNTDCTTFTASIGSASNIYNGQYCLYNATGTLIACNTTGVFNNLLYGNYCMYIKNDAACFDTTIMKCFTAGQPLPAADNNVAISNKTCKTFSAQITGQQNFTNPQYCLYDSTNTVVACNTTGQFDNIINGAYCIQIKNDPTCMDTTIQRCFSVVSSVPYISSTVRISNRACSTFTATLSRQKNLTNPQFCLYDTSNNVISCNTTGQFDSIPYGSYCINLVNTCYDTTITRCFTATANPITVTVNSAASCNIGTTDLTVNIANGMAPYTINIYNPGGVLVSSTSSLTSSSTISGLPALPAGVQYRVMAMGACSGIDSANVTPVVYTLNKSINANSKCPGGLSLNGSGDLVVNAQFSGGSIIPSIISEDGSATNISYSSQSGSNYTFSNLQPAAYVIKYTLQGCGTLVYDTFNLKPYTYPSLAQSAIYQCNNNSFSVNAVSNGGISPFTYQIIGSNPSFPTIISLTQLLPAFNINNGTIYSLVRLRAIDACGNATINDASILPLANTVITASSNCYYNAINLTVDSVPNASYSWYKKTSSTDSVLIGNNQSNTIPYLLPSDTGTYVNVMSLNSGCLQRVSYFSVNGACGGLLDVSGLAFSASAEKNNVQLKWTTARSFDATAFVIERSTDGANFKELGMVKVSSANAISICQYLFSDNNVAAGKNYYRLRIVKANGSIAYSNVAEIEMKGKVAVSVMPNPVADAFTIRFQPVTSTNYSVNLVSAEGKTIINTIYSVRPGESKTIQRPNGIATGVYYLAVLNLITNEKDIIKLFFK